ncbi:hypothetical protein BDY19DRAFT_184941 [Irpex rosettiformis]|uniref:Uncharacterized protein n=1 Tax=Irpex rosettiformis TaxID=378272 RepID=A0ACB8U1I2_9APHY|nr:hypothetical protein BDY19DRAFT_184941 [Irpex rosettiformis]
MPASSLSMAGTSEQLTGQPSQAGSQDRPERSRNAKAQARHRAKRKAYIEQLEQTVVRLQNALASSPDQVSSLPPPLLRIRELEQENVQLSREVEELRRQLEARNARLRPDIDHRHHGFSPYDDRHFDREAKRRRAMQIPDEPYLLANNQLPSPPLSTASSLTPYTHTTSTSMTQQRSPTATTPMTSYSMAYPMPETPSSSTASSPSTTSFSASVPSFLPLCHAQDVYGMNFGS